MKMVLLRGWNSCSWLQTEPRREKTPRCRTVQATGLVLPGWKGTTSCPFLWDSEELQDRSPFPGTNRSLTVQPLFCSHSPASGQSLRAVASCCLGRSRGNGSAEQPQAGEELQPLPLGKRRL